MAGLTVTKIADRIPTEADAYRYVEFLRWDNDEPTCPHCDNVGATFIQPTNGASRKTRTGAKTERRVWRCRSCRKQFSAITGTVFHGTKVSLRTWVLVIFEMVLSKNGVAAREIERKYGVCPRTAWHMLHRVRLAMESDALIQSMTGVIEADETFIGGKPQNRHQQGKATAYSGKDRPSHHREKVPVLTLVNRTTGEARSRVVPDVTGPTLAKAIAEQVDASASHLRTDGWMPYRKIGEGFESFAFVDHGSREYVRGDAHTNSAEGFFSQLKRSIDGTHHHVSREHLPRYLAEFDFRYSTRKMNDTERLVNLMGKIGGKRLTYKRISGQ